MVVRSCAGSEDTYVASIKYHMLALLAANGCPRRLRGPAMPHRPRTPIRWLAALGQTALAAAQALAESFSDMQSSPQQAAWQRLDLSVFVDRRQHRPRRPVAAGHRPEQARPAAQADVKCLEEMGQALQARYGAERTLVRGRLKAGDAIAAAVDGDRDTFWTAPAGSHHATLELQFKQSLSFDPTMAAEWRNDGQLARKYAKCCATGAGARRRRGSGI
ncbi:hypothetical protein [Xanthomonas translucens]|uniref:hypothetical protein n=1 Tax=Xanthomonas campestris pv. translucens TaxID=343 RepID=UPI0012D9E0DD|nr:hypothetical protein [Xanthomonas translucens]